MREKSALDFGEKNLGAFSADEICRILVSCKDLPLKSIKVGNLFIEFTGFPEKKTFDKSQNLAGRLDQTEHQNQGEMIEPLDAESIQDEIDQENMMILDPIGYERDLLDDQVYSNGSSGLGVDAKVKSRRT